MIATKTVNNYFIALSPIVHNEILAKDVSLPKGAPNPLRTMPFIATDGIINLDDGKECGITLDDATVYQVPIISGNSARGIIRRLLVDFSLDELGIKMSDIFDNSAIEKKIIYLFRNGGLTPRGISTEKSKIGTYAKIKQIPWLRLLGGTYNGHHFAGCLNEGFIIPICDVTATYCKKYLWTDEQRQTPIPTLDSLMSESNVIRYTRRSSEDSGEAVEEVVDEESNKEAMIFGTKVLPTGTCFIQHNIYANHEEDEGASLAFDAAMSLFVNYGIVGGVAGRGHGRMLIDSNVNLSDALKKYSDYLKKHKDSIIESIKLIPDGLKASKKKSTKKDSSDDEGVDNE